MKIIKQEVRTKYNIEVSFKDFIDAKEAWVKDNALQILYPKAFDNEEMTMGLLSNEFKQFNTHGHRAALLAEYLGFDGWENAGLYKESKKAIVMCVYNNGDCINKK